jgi:nuclear transport factor 2 (NTF2) superfamily protein
LWEFTDDGLMRRREASINDVPIDEGDRWIRGPRAARERGLLLRSGEPEIANIRGDFDE